MIVEFNRRSILTSNPPVFDRTFGDNGSYQGMGRLCLEPPTGLARALDYRRPRKAAARDWGSTQDTVHRCNSLALHPSDFIGMVGVKGFRCIILPRETNGSQLDPSWRNPSECPRRRQNRSSLDRVDHMDRGRQRAEQSDDREDRKSQSEFGSTIACELPKRFAPCLVVGRRRKLRRQAKPVNGSEH